ncbi:uncharacterized protein CcaverHIS019_0401790 [Cutaneotrichosporon cavernicola]|uniref:NAD-dependent epimerase/dehydratase domain-containing protein n=1 Tax=Cutaneotrichosporon cavernicola TaxID=279322 RepID=A0AA48L3M3_9TREE|nr:uncharacterized protein CcaverHIS019_0401790 [Cutaneotrichosporon cavernicola]BEI91359.1 hypothetical protein CcaverHIS019_0401790 [Cutaneotrichosporon cavernicola]
MSKLTIAITGANGVIGRGVVSHALAEGHNVVAVDIAPEPHPNAGGEGYTFKSVDMMKEADFRKAIEGCDALIHLAAVYSLQNPTDPDGPLLRYVPEETVHNVNSTMSWNALQAAGEVGIERISMASSVNAIGLIFSKPRPHFDYLPLDEEHTRYPQDSYSLCKLAVEEQAAAFCRRYPKMRIGCFRPHWVIPESLAYNPEALHAAQGNWKDLWGWTSVGGTARAFLAGITAPTSTFPLGAENFFIVAPTIVQQSSSLELLRKYYPDLKCEMRREWKANEGFFDCSKAKHMLGWEERAFPWTPE